MFYLNNYYEEIVSTSWTSSTEPGLYHYTEDWLRQLTESEKSKEFKKVSEIAKKNNWYPIWNKVLAGLVLSGKIKPEYANWEELTLIEKHDVFVSASRRKSNILEILDRVKFYYNLEDISNRDNVEGKLNLKEFLIKDVLKSTRACKKRNPKLVNIINSLDLEFNPERFGNSGPPSLYRSHNFKYFSLDYSKIISSIKIGNNKIETDLLTAVMYNEIAYEVKQLVKTNSNKYKTVGYDGKEYEDISSYLKSYFPHPELEKYTEIYLRDLMTRAKSNKNIYLSAIMDVFSIKNIETTPKKSFKL